MADASAGQLRSRFRSAQFLGAWAGVSVLLILMFYPGITSKDSIASLEQARSLEFTDWHPPIFAIIWRPLDQLIPGAGLMLIAQCMIYAAAATKFCAVGLRDLHGRLPPWLIVAGFALFPPAMSLAGMIWKDIWMSALLLWATAFLIQLRDTPPDKGKLWPCVAILACCLAATAFRHNAMAATAGLLAGLFFYALPFPRAMARLTVSCALGVVLAITFFALVTASYRAISRPAYIATAVRIQDIAGIILHSGEPEVAAQLAVAWAPELTNEPGHLVARLRTSYPDNLVRSSRRKKAPFSVNVFDLSREDADSVDRAWFQLVRRYPRAYTEHRVSRFACLLQLCDRNRWAVRSYVLNASYIFPESLPHDSLQRWLRNIFLSPALIKLYAPIAWLLVSTIGVLIGFWRFRRPDGVLLFIGLSAVGLAFSIFMTTPTESYRYVHWVTLAGWGIVWMWVDSLVGRHPSRRSDNYARLNSA